jgi:hypothetical protein
VHVLVTSRERLDIPAEQTVPISSLPLASDAEQLFCARALAADPQFVADPAGVAELCARLDGLPLAIELAAARGASLGPTGLLAALDDALRLLSGGRGGEKRHRSLHAVLSWSYDLLHEDEQALFRRLGAFVGAFDIDAAAAVGGDDRARTADQLGRLVDKSLVVHVRGAQSRWRLLETVRAFAIAQLAAAGEQDKTQARHLRWAADAASAVEGRLDEPGWRAEFDAVAADLRAALAAAGGPDEETHRLASALAHLTFARRHLMESFAHHRTAAAVATSAAAAARDLRAGAGCAHVSTTSNQQVHELLLEAAEQARRAGDDRGRVIDLARAVETACRFPEAFETPVTHEYLHSLLGDAVAAAPDNDPEATACIGVAGAWVAGPHLGAPDPELASATVSAARATGDPVLISSALCAVATAALLAGRLSEAHRITGERLQLLAAMDRNDPYCAPEICNTYGRACLYAIMTGDLRSALASAQAGIDDDLLRNTHITASRMVAPLALTGRFDDALGHAEQMWDRWERAGRPAPLWMLPAVCASVLAGAMLEQPQVVALWRARAAQVAGNALSTAAGCALGEAAVAAFVDARLAVDDPPADAEALVRRAFAVDDPLDPYLAYARAAGAELAVAARLPDAEALIAAATPYAEENAWARACLTRAQGRLHGDRAEFARAVAGWDRLGARAERDATQALLARAR